MSNGNDGQEYLERGKARLTGGRVKINRLKDLTNQHNTCLAYGAKLLERAYDTYMEGERLADWEEFELCMKEATIMFQNAIANLHKLAEIVPSQVEPERYTELKGIINRTNDTLLGYHTHWGKRLIKEEQDRIQALTHWSCAALQVAGIDPPHHQLDSVAGEAFCKNECKYRPPLGHCDGEGL